MLDIECEESLFKFLDLFKKTIKTITDKYILICEIAEIIKLSQLKDVKHRSHF